MLYWVALAPMRAVLGLYLWLSHSYTSQLAANMVKMELGVWLKSMSNDNTLYEGDGGICFTDPYPQNQLFELHIEGVC